MLGIQDLKPKITITPTTVECPVKGCSRSVDRQRRSFRREERFQCPDHKIYISPSTFEYASEEDNLLWHDKADLDLLKSTKKVKRESRIARDNSEDALTWNTFRYLEKTNQLANFLFCVTQGFEKTNQLANSPSHVTQPNHSCAELVYWSYSQKEQGAWHELNNARKEQRAWRELNNAREEFGENLQRGSEPDLIAVTDKALFFIEAKLTATNDTSPSDPNNRKKYLTGGNEWHRRVFKPDFNTVAVRAKKYELYRFWLLGSWLAKEMERDFYLLNIVLSERDPDIEAQFNPHIQDSQRKFKRLSWEGIYSYIAKNVPDSGDKRILSAYFQGKTIGYSNGKLQKAFCLNK
jgi:hypothetical protein